MFWCTYIQIHHITATSCFSSISKTSQISVCMSCNCEILFIVYISDFELGNIKSIKVFFLFCEYCVICFFKYVGKCCLYCYIIGAYT